MFPQFVPWDWLNLIIVGFFLGLGWQVAVLIYHAVMSLFQRG